MELSKSGQSKKPDEPFALFDQPQRAAGFVHRHQFVHEPAIQDESRQQRVDVGHRLECYGALREYRPAGAKSVAELGFVECGCKNADQQPGSWGLVAAARRR